MVNVIYTGKRNNTEIKSNKERYVDIYLKEATSSLSSDGNVN